jgi:uncharacterized protein (DUF433 family)
MVAVKRDRLLDQPAYTLREATRLTAIGFGTLHSWTHGTRGPIIRLSSDFWSFTNIVEAHTLRALRKTHRLRLEAVRRAVRYVESKLRIPHPLASRDFQTDGADLFVERFGQLINVSREGQLAIRELIAEQLRHIDYGRDGRAAKLYVDGDRRLIVMDPAVNYGRPVVAGSRVPVEMIVSRFKGGELPVEIARDYDLGEEKVLEALRISMPDAA